MILMLYAENFSWDVLDEFVATGEPVVLCGEPVSIDLLKRMFRHGVLEYCEDLQRLNEVRRKLSAS